MIPYSVYSVYDFPIYFMHISSVFSRTINPSGDSLAMQDSLLPLIIKYEVDAYISGTDHLSAHMQYNGTEFYIAGAGIVYYSVL